jgi:flavin reductase (DIM6/NTAB) family NADH-FMN oxidoreductase RutF
MKKSLGAKTLLFPTPVLLVGTYDQNEKPNLMNVAWGGICCSQPPCVAVSLRKREEIIEVIKGLKSSSPSA